MSSTEQIEKLLDYIGVDSHTRRWRGEQINFCCPIHGERHPSCGINIEKEVFHCFACGEGGTLEWFLYKSLPDEFKSPVQAARFLRNEFNITPDINEDYIKRKLVRYEDFFIRDEEDRHITPLKFLAPFKSGKETYQYFYDRGFTKKTVRDFMIGRDLKNETVTIPVFWEDNVLAGVIGRYVTKRRKHERFKIYNFPKGDLLFPLDKYNQDSEALILVEGLFDAIWLYQLGYDNVLALMTNDITSKQVDIIYHLTENVIIFMDNDEMGHEGQENVLKKLKAKGLNIKVVTNYPEHGKDPCDWSLEEIEWCLVNAKNPLLRTKLKRL